MQLPSLLVCFWACPSIPPLRRHTLWIVPKTMIDYLFSLTKANLADGVKLEVLRELLQPLDLAPRVRHRTASPARARSCPRVAGRAAHPAADEGGLRLRSRVPHRLPARSQHVLPVLGVLQVNQVVV